MWWDCIGYVTRESSGESIEITHSRIDETPLKSHSHVTGKKKLKNFVMKSMNIFTPVKSNNANFDGGNFTAGK